MNGKITITREKYNELREKAKRLDIIQKLAFEGEVFFHEPTTKNISTIIRTMERTGRYTRDFLKSLETGLKRSSYFSK